MLEAMLHLMELSEDTSKHKRSGGGSVTFGTNDIRDLSASLPVTCIRRYADVDPKRACGVKHRSKKAAMKCANSLSRGWLSRAKGPSWVEIVDWKPEEG